MRQEFRSWRRRQRGTIHQFADLHSLVILQELLSKNHISSNDYFMKLYQKFVAKNEVDSKDF